MAHETVEQAAARQGYRLLVDCREGGCGTCKARCTAGEFDLEDYSDTALSETERAEGFVLTCRMRVAGPCVVELDYPLSQARSGLALAPCAAVVTGVVPLTAEVVHLELAAADGRPFEFLPGQYANLAVPGAEAWRSYSFANLPGGDRAEFLVRMLQGGAMSSWVRMAAPGATLKVGPATGRFFLRDVARCPLLFVAGGTGVAPVLSMLRSLAAAPAKPASTCVVFGVNHPAGLFREPEIEAALAALPGGRLVRAVMDPAGAAWPHAVGTAADVAAALAPAADTQVYLCGPPPMVERARHLLRGLGVPAAAIFAEAFVPTTAAAA